MSPAVILPALPRLSAAALACALALAPAASSRAAQDGAALPSDSVQPGRWEYRYKIFALPVATEHWCLKPEEIEKAFAGPCNRHHTCTYPVREFGDGKVRLQGRWVDKRGRVAPVSGQGSYTPTTIKLSVRGRTINGIPFVGSMNARRIGDACEAGDK
jgi:hypothetical protein